MYTQAQTWFSLWNPECQVLLILRVVMENRIRMGFLNWFQDFWNWFSSLIGLREVMILFPVVKKALKVSDVKQQQR